MEHPPLVARGGLEERVGLRNSSEGPPTGTKPGSVSFFATSGLLAAAAISVKAGKITLD